MKNVLVVEDSATMRRMVMSLMREIEQAPSLAFAFSW